MAWYDPTSWFNTNNGNMADQLNNFSTPQGGGGLINPSSSAGSFSGAGGTTPFGTPPVPGIGRFGTSYGGPGADATGGNVGFGWNVGTGQLALGGLQALGNLWGAMQANKLGQKQFQLAQQVSDTNIGNQIKTFNTALEDKIGARAKTEGLAPEQVSDYLSRNRLVR